MIPKLRTWDEQKLRDYWRMSNGLYLEVKIQMNVPRMKDEFDRVYVRTDTSS